MAKYVKNIHAKNYSQNVVDVFLGHSTINYYTVSPKKLPRHFRL